MRNYLFSMLMAIALITNCQWADAQTTLLNQNFNNTTSGVPANWDNSDYTCYSSYIWQSDADGYNGTRCMKFNTYNASSGSYSTLKTPVLNLNVPYILRFKYRNATSNPLEVRISLDGGSTYSATLANNLFTSSDSEWLEVEYSLTPYIGNSNVRIVFYAVSDYGSYRMYIDDVVVESAPTCKSPTGLYVSNLNTSSATLNWSLTTDGDIPTTYSLLVTDQSGTTIVSDNAVPGSSISYNLSGLQANTTYNVTMRGDCNPTLGGYSSYSNFTFTTACNPASFPYTENFDALSRIPDCTTSINASLDGSVYYGTSGKSLKLATTASNAAYMIFPLMNHAVSDVEMTFFARCGSTNPIAYQVGVVDDLSDIEGTFVPIRTDSLTSGTTWEEIRLNTASYQSASTTVNMCIFVQAAATNSFYVDNVSIHAIPSCVRPEQFRAYNVTHTSVDLSWTTSIASTHIVEITGPGTTVSTVNAMTNPYTLTGLQPNTQYSLRLRALCAPGDTSEYTSGTISVKTLCAPMTSAIWSEGAEGTTGNALPDCWSMGWINRTGYSTYDQPIITQTSNVHSGSRSFQLRDMSSGNICYIASNGFSVDVANKYQASIWIYRPSGTSYVGEGLRLFASNSPDDLSAAQELGFINRQAGNAPVETTTGWHNYTFPISLTGIVYLIVQGESKYGSATYFDDISVQLAPTCYPAGDISLGTPTMNDNTISWSAGVSGETSWALAYELRQGNNIVTSDSLVLTQPTYTLTGLSSSTSYSVTARVYAMCSPTDMAAAKTFSGTFKTPCASVSIFPYYVDFESMTTGQTPDCWDISGSTTSTASSTPSYVWGVYSYNNNQMLRMYNWYVQSGSALIETPELQLPAQPAAELQFDYSNRANCGDIYVKISTDGGATFANLNSYGTTASTSQTDPGTFTTATIDLAAYAGQNVILQFYSVANYESGAMFIDNVLIRMQPTCRDLPAPTVVNIQPTTATVMIADTASMWDISYGVQGTAAGAGTIITVNGTNAYALTGLTNNTTYDVYVRRNCGTEVGAWTLIPVSFTTQCADLYATYSDIGARSFKVTTDALEWDISYGPLGTQPGTNIYSVSNSLDYTVTGLTPSTSYVFYVRRACGPVFSDWSYSYTVTTTSVPDSIPYGTGFENSAQDNSWTFVNGSSTTNVFTIGSDANAVASGSRALYITNGSGYGYSTSSATKTYAYHTLYFGSGVHTVSFQWKCTGGESSWDFGRVMLVSASEVLTGGSGTSYSSTTFPNYLFAFDPEGKNYMNLTTGDANGWNSYTTDIDMTGHEGTYNFVVMWNDDSSYGTSSYPISIDNISITRLTCPRPVVMTTSTSSTGTTVNVVTQDATQWEIVVSSTPIDIYGTVSGDIYQQISSAPAVISGLSANTEYYYTARIICSPGDTSVWADAHSFRTSCTAYNVPYTEDFDDTGALACWPSFGNQIPSRNTSYKYGGTASCKIADGTAVSPELNVTSLATYMLTGMCYSTNDSTVFAVGVITDPEDASTYIDLGYVTIPTSGTWTEFTTYFTLLSDPDYIDFANARHFAITAGADAVVYVDNVYLGPTPTCPKPTEPLISNVTSNSFNFGWTENGTATSWRVMAVPATVGQPTIDTIVHTNPVTISGLNAASAYSVKIAAICSAADTSLISECGSVTTACDIVTAPYSEDFEAMTVNAIPNCWDNSATTCTASQDDYMWGIHADGGNKMIRMHNYLCHSDGDAIIATPQIALTGSVNGYEVKFDYCHQASCDPFTFEISSDNGVTWTTLGTYSSNSSGSYTTPNTWTTASVNLYAYNGNTVLFRFNSDPDYGSGAIFIDNIRVLALRACSDPQSVSVAPSETSALVTFVDPVPTHTQWQYVYGAPGFDPATATPVTVNTYSFTLTGLAATTAYEIYVRAYCDSIEQSNWIKASFSTTATPASLPYVCHFTDAAENAEWLYRTSGGSNYFTIGTASAACGSGETAALYVTNGSGYTYSSSSSSAAAAYRLFYFHASQFNLSLSWKCTGGESSYDWARFYLVPASDPVYLPSAGYYSSSGWPADMIALDGGTKVNLCNTPEWNLVDTVIDMSSRPGSYYLVFIWSNDNSAGTTSYPLAVNDIEISEVSCPAPGNVNIPAATVTQTSAVVNYTDNTQGSATIRYWINTTGNRTDVLQSGTLTSSPFTINGLSASTTYYLFMQSECSATDVSPVVRTSFSTSCGIVNSFPFTEGFEGAQFPPNCWTSTPSPNSMEWSRYSTTSSSSSYVHSGSASAYLYDGYIDGDVALLATPQIHFDGAREYNLSFYMYRSTSTYYTDEVRVYISDSPDALLNQTLLSTTVVGGASSSGMQQVQFDLPAGISGDKYIVFEGMYDYYGYVYIDDITLDIYATCRSLQSAPTVEATTATTMTVSQVMEPSHVGVIFAYAPANAVSVADSIGSVYSTTGTAVITGLTPGTTYKVFARGVCSATDSTIWTMSVSGTTMTSDCFQPQNLHIVGSVGADSVTIAWGGAPESTGYDWELTGTSISGTTTIDTVCIGGLSPKVSYTFRVRTNCTGSTTSWVTLSFTTIPVPGSLPYDCDFEDQSEAIHWESHNGSQTNGFYVGTATSNGGSSSLYISNDNGTSNAYNTSSSAVSFATRFFQLPAGRYTYSYDWNCNGESIYDYGRAFLAPSTATLTPGTLPSGVSKTGTPTGWIALDGDSKLNQVTSWQNVNGSFDITTAGNYMWVFLWRDDTSVGTNPPLAVDNVHLALLFSAPAISDTTCFGEPYMRHGFNVSSTDLQVGVNQLQRVQAGAPGAPDTVVTVNLFQRAQIQSLSYDTLCQGAPLVWGGYTIPNPTSRAYTQQGFVSVTGCDSSAVLMLTVIPNFHERFDTICRGDVYPFGGQNLTNSGDYYNFGQSPYGGCTDTTLLHLAVLETNDTLYERICQGSFFSWHGTNYTTSGTYRWSGTGSHGCPRNEVLHLSVIDGDSTMNVTICQGGQYLFIDTLITTAGTYRRSYYDYLIGCDVTITLHASVDVIVPVDVYDDACEGIPYNRHGVSAVIITQDTIIQRTTKSASLCDSVTNIHITYHATEYADTFAYLKTGEYITWRGNTYSGAGEHTETVQTIYGCDSVITLHIIINDAVTTVSDVNMTIVPNPVNAGATALVYGDFGDVSRVEILNSFGQLIETFVPDTYPIEVTGISASGIYYVRVTTTSGTVHLQKLMVK